MKIGDTRTVDNCKEIVVEVDNGSGGTVLLWQPVQAPETGAKATVRANVTFDGSGAVVEDFPQDWVTSKKESLMSEEPVHPPGFSRWGVVGVILFASSAIVTVVILWATFSSH